MPSYRYLRDIEPENGQPEQQRVYTEKEKLANWWHYHWYFVAGGVALLAIAVFFIVDVLGVKKPDYTMAILSPYHISQSVADGVSDGLQAVLDDANGDGEVVVQVDIWNVSVDEETAGPHDGALVKAGAEEVMAGATKLQTALMTGETPVFVCDPAYLDAYQEIFQLYGDENGNLAGADGAGGEYTVAWGDMPLLTGLDLGEVGAQWQDLLNDWRVGMRPLYGTSIENDGDAVKYWQTQTAFFEQLQGK